jgi:lysozyme
MRNTVIAILLLLAGFLFFTNKKSIERKQKESEVFFGIDISQYQGVIDWDRVSTQKKHPITFVVCRATMGIKRKDKMFEYNYATAKEKGFVVGAYHYYDPNENSIEQAKNYIRQIRKFVGKGDFVPILDIENYSRVQTKKELAEGVKKWLAFVEDEYGVKPIIYTGFAYYKDFLSLHISGEYPLWIAAYSHSKRNHPIVQNAAIHQFTEKVRVPGIPENRVDGNDIKRDSFQNFVLK